MNYFESAKLLQNDMVAYRRYFHQHAELGHELPQTTAYVIKKLTDFGYTPAEICKSGVVATIGKPGKTAMLRADMDALPMKEESGLPFACTESFAAHTCGHDLHTAALLGTARLLRENEDALRGTVKLMFQPAEEVLTGSKAMIDAGVLENPKVDIAFAGHVTPRYPTGIIALRSGVAMASCYGFRIRIKGFSAHGCYPEQSISPINIGSHIYLALQELIARETDPMKSAVLTVGSFHSGSMPNTIPGEACMEGTLRTFDQSLTAFLIERLNCVVEKTAEVFRGKAEVEVMWNVPTEYNDPKLSEDVGRYYKDLFGREAKEDILIAGAEDFAFISRLVPTVDLYIGATDPAHPDSFYPSHNPKVVFDEGVLSLSAALNAEVATRWLNENQ
jgi:amidohydrolase